MVQSLDSSNSSVYISQQIFSKSRIFSQLASERLQWVWLKAICVRNWQWQVRLRLLRKASGAFPLFFFFVLILVLLLRGSWRQSGHLANFFRSLSMREATFSPSSCNSWVQMLGSCFRRLPSAASCDMWDISCFHRLLSAASLSRSCRSLQGQQGQLSWQQLGYLAVSLPSHLFLWLIMLNGIRGTSSQDNISVSFWMQRMPNKTELKSEQAAGWRDTSLLGLEADLPIPLEWDLDEPRAPQRKIAPGWGSGGSTFSTSVVFKE